MATAAPARPHIAPVQYAGFWLRVVAWLIDFVIMSIVMFVVNAVLGTVFGLGIGALAKPGADPSAQNVAALLATVGTFLLITITLAFAIQFAYFTYMESSEKQGTVGKMLLGLKVTGLDGKRISFARAAGRFFAKILSGLGLCIGYMMVGFTEKKQGLHDMVASTLVVRAK